MIEALTLRGFGARYRTLDPRVPVALILFIYLTLTLTVLGFHRTPAQAAITTVSCLAFELACSWVFRGRLFYPLSIFITSLSLSFLLSIEHGSYLLIVPVFYAVASKYILTYDGKHFFNPAGAAVSLSILTSHHMITAASAAQWNSLPLMPFLVVFFALAFVIPKVSRTWLVVSYFLSFTFFAIIRFYLNPGAISSGVLIWGTLSSPAFLIFLFFMITDPATSPPSARDQLWYGFFLAGIDFLLHLREHYFTFFLALFILTWIRFLFRHASAAWREGAKEYITKRFLHSRYYLRPIFLGGLFLAGTGLKRLESWPQVASAVPTWAFVKVPSAYSGLKGSEDGHLEELVDPKAKHLGFLLGLGDAVAVGDVDGDGLPDIFLTNMRKSKEERCALYRNLGKRRFQRVDVPALRAICDHPEENGLVSNAIFVDFDNSGAQSLFLSTLAGHPHLLKNLIQQTGKLDFKDVSREAGLSDIYTNSMGATFADFNKDGLLDLLITNYWETSLPGYRPPRLLNIFHLPDPEYPGDSRMFDFMPDNPVLGANNGGGGILLLQSPDHVFIRQTAEDSGISDQHWYFGAGVADFNHDGWPDIYAIRDYGTDDVYVNEGGKKFSLLKGLRKEGGRKSFAHNGMNQSIADYDRTGWLQIYVSDTHHAFLTHGSSLWEFSPGTDPMHPKVEDKAFEKGVINEDRFGWGAAAVDFSNEGWVGIAQANGGFDSRWKENSNKPCTDFFYLMEKTLRLPPSYLRFGNNWPSDEGACLFAKEKNRIYLNRGPDVHPQFVDIADQVGVADAAESKGVAAADLENSGRMDLIFTHLHAEPTLYQNVAKVADHNQWIGFDLESLHPGCNREAIGTKVTISVSKVSEPGFSIAQEKQMVGGFAAQSDKRIHFGLGQGVASVSARVDWCYGAKIQLFENLSPNQYHKLVLLP